MKSFDKQFWKALGLSALMAVAAVWVATIVTGCTTVHQAQVQSQTASWDEASTQTPSSLPIGAPLAASGGAMAQNSGVLAKVVGGYVITAHFRDRYNGLIAVYGKSKTKDGSPIFTPPLKKDDGISPLPAGVALGNYGQAAAWSIDDQAMEDMVIMSRLKRQGFQP